MVKDTWLHKAIEQQAHPSWHSMLYQACATLPADYIAFLDSHEWLPGKNNIFNAFSLPLPKTQYILYGESPYPRQASAIGFAFWDGAVGSIWSKTGLSKEVNRATSLRNLIKMLLLIEGYQSPLEAAAVQEQFVRTLDDVFQNLLNHGFLLLNASLALSSLDKNYEARYWLPFHECILEALAVDSPSTTLILFGKIAEKILALPASNAFPQVIAEHPFNLSFITNPKIQKFFKPFRLLRAVPHA